MKTIPRVTLVCTLLVMFLPACTSTRESPTYTPVLTVVEPGLAYGEPCKPPCWRGMIPGKTTKQEADRAMEQLRSSGWASYIDEGPKGYVIQPLDIPYGYISLGLENDAISKIVGQVIFDYPVETMTKQFGTPEVTYRRERKNSAEERSCTDWKPPDYSSMWDTLVQVLYPQQGLYFIVSVPENGLGLICPEMEVVSFCYYPPLSLQEALNNDYLANLCNVDALKGLTEQKLVKWHGFGSGY